MDPSLVIFFLTFFAAVQALYREGDVILGGIVPIHLRGTSEGKCGEFFPSALGRALAMIYAIEQINNDSKLLPNVTLGYDIRDYCESISKATQITYDLVKDKCLSNTTRNDKGEKSIVALIGPNESRSAIAVAGLLQTLNASGITPSATSAELSSHAYKHLFRMLPSDDFRTKAIADIIERFNWSYVAAVGQDDSFGRNGMWSLIKEAATRNSFCVALTEFIPNEGRLLSITNIVTTLRRNDNIRVVILWLYGSSEIHFFGEVSRQNLTGRVWILGDSFNSMSYTSIYTFVRGSIAFQPKNFSDMRFQRYKNALTMETMQQYFPEWWIEIRALIRNCSARDINAVTTDLCFHDFVQSLHGAYIPYVIDAVYSVAHALDILVQDFSNTGDGYLRKLNSEINVMQRLLSKVNFVGRTGKITFNELGERRSAFYDIINLQQDQEANTTRLKEVVVGKWKENREYDKRLHLFKKIRWNSPSGDPPNSQCLDQCSAGTRKSMTSPCCWQCVSCPRGTVNPIPGSKSCWECPRGKQSNEARTKCVDLPLTNLKYSSAGGIVILAFSACGVIATLFSFAVTCRYWKTPIVKASNREFSIALLIGNLSMLTLVIINLFEPTDTTCKIIYPLRYITHNLCLSFLLVKILRISSAFQVPIARRLMLSSLTNRMQGVIIITMHIPLLLVLLPWLLLDPPFKRKYILTEQYIFIECQAYNLVVGKTLFLVTCSYLLLQTFFSAFCSFKIRNIPENFSETKRIAFSMYIFLFSLLAYHPVEFSMDGWYVTVVDCVTTLLSAYGFLCCILLPKMYIILFRPELNNVSQIRHEVTQFSFGLNSAVFGNAVFDISIQHGQT